MAVPQGEGKADGAPPSSSGKQDKKDAKPTDPDADLSEEDLELKKNIELMVERVQDGDAGVAKAALDSITREIHTTTSSMTAVPKPLKFLRPHLEGLAAFFERMPAGPNRATLADVLSLLYSTVAGKEGERIGLRYKLQVRAARAGLPRDAQHAFQPQPSACAAGTCMHACGAPVQLPHSTQHIARSSSSSTRHTCAARRATRMTWRRGDTSTCATWLARSRRSSRRATRRAPPRTTSWRW